MREISVELVKKTVEELCVKANLYLPDGMKEKINSCIGCEKSPLSKQVLGDIVRNIDCAKELEVPICQDTGMAVSYTHLDVYKRQLLYCLYPLRQQQAVYM